MSFSSQRVEKSLKRRDKLSVGWQPPHLHMAEPLVIYWQMVDPTKTLETSEDARSQDESEYYQESTASIQAEDEAWNLEVCKRLSMFFTNHSGNILVHFCMIYKRYKDKQRSVCYVKRLQAHTLLVLVSFEDKLLQNVREGVLKCWGVIWPSLHFTEHNFKILKVFLSNSRNVLLQCSKRGDWA